MEWAEHDDDQKGSSPPSVAEAAQFLDRLGGIPGVCGCDGIALAGLHPAG